MATWSPYFTYVGLAFVTFKLFKLVWWLADTFWTFFLGKSVNLKELGQWAVITGATDGIGKEYAKQIAQRGMNVVLISRSLAKLQDVAKEIGSESNVQVMVIVTDFTGDLDIYAKIKEHLSGLDVGLFVNNVGMGVDPQYIAEIDEKVQRDIIIINCMACTMLSQLILPSMIAKKKGAIVNVSSGSCLHPTPMISVYSATKAYVDFFTRALQVEAAGTGVIIQLLVPFFVCTKLSGMRRSSFFVPTPKTYVRQSLNTIGQQDYTFGSFAHAIQGALTSAIPSRLYGRLALPVMTKAMERIKRRKEKIK